MGQSEQQSPAVGEPISEIDQLRQLFEHAPGFMAATHGPDHVFRMANASYRHLIGDRDLVGRSVAQVFPDLADTGFVDLLDAVYASGKARTGRSAPMRLRRKPGGPLELRHLDYVFQPITDRAGAVTGIFVEGYDITDRHEAEQILRESEERFRLIADSAPVPIWVSKLDRKRSFANRAYVEFVGLPFEQAIELDWRTILHPDDIERVTAESIAGEASLRLFVLEARYRRGDGEWRWLRSESQPRLGPNGEHLGFIGVAHDITQAKQAEEALQLRIDAEVAERLRAEEALRQAQKMEAVGQLTGGIAHDFNNLLTPILGGLELIARRTDDERTQRIAANALEAARRGVKLTSQLLAFSRLQRVSMAPVAVNDVVANMQDMLRQTLGQSVRIETGLADDAGYGLCDVNQLENAILNLGINARDAMPDGGTLTLSTERLELTGEPDLADGPYLCLTVADTGAGMTPDVLQRATEPFFSTKPLGKGTGLGLAQVYAIAQQSGGTLRIDSAPGAGTRVRLCLPSAIAGPATIDDAPPAFSSRSAGDGAAILVIDDDRDVRAFLSTALQELGHQVRLAHDGPDGLAKIRASPPSLVLVDYAMPVMNGAEVARAARVIDPNLPIVFVTGYAETEQLEAALGSDAPVLRKPFTVAQLMAVIERNLPARLPT